MIEEIVTGMKSDFGINSLALHCDSDGWTASGYVVGGNPLYPEGGGIAVGNASETIAEALASLAALFEEGWK